MSTKGKVLVAMSGGIDSSISAILLQEEGYEVIGVTFRVWDYQSTGCLEKEKGCCSMDAIYEAKAIAEKLGFPHHILDLRDLFKKSVIDRFISQYLSGNTPNPCVDCNSHIKWGAIIQKADELNCEYIATGHYAKIKKENNRYILSKGIDQSKDQSYFLWSLSQDNLKRTIFPLGEYTKNEIKEIANKKGFEKLARKRESQEICFIPDNDYRAFLKKHITGLEEKLDGGDFVSVEGEFLGKHKGYPFYTIGQRKGLVIAKGYPLYVTDIDAKNNRITLGKKEDLFKKEMIVTNLNLIKYNKLPEIELATKIRYRDKGNLANVNMIDDKIKVVFKENVAGITPGQSAVFYEGDDVVGGGIIANINLQQ